MCVCNPVCADGALVCALCGVAITIGTQYVHTPIIDKYGRFFPHASRLRYNRARRFSRIIANTYGHRVPVLDAKLYPHLLPCTDIQSVFRVIRSLEARWAKRYDAVAWIYVNIIGGTIRPLSASNYAWCIGQFKKLEILHRYHRGSFPAYSWICEELFRQIGRTDLLVFLHKLKCRKRRRTYAELYHSVLTGKSEIPLGIIETPWETLGKSGSHRTCIRPVRQVACGADTHRAAQAQGRVLSTPTRSVFDLLQAPDLENLVASMVCSVGPAPKVKNNSLRLQTSFSYGSQNFGVGR